MTAESQLAAVGDLLALRGVAVDLASVVPPLAAAEDLDEIVASRTQPAHALQWLSERQEAIEGVHALLGPVIAGRVGLERGRTYLRRACLVLNSELGVDPTKILALLDPEHVSAEPRP